MAFAGIAMMFLFITLVVVGGSTLIGTVLLIVAGVMQKKQKKNYMVPRVFGIILMVPLILCVVLILYAVIATQIQNYNSLAYNVNHGNYERVEAILQKGITPDCTMESNEAAKDGEKTILAVLCANGGFVDSFGDPIDNEVTKEEEDMIQLLLQYGADMEARSYHHEKEYSRHELSEITNYYSTDDGCGYTPLLYAVRYREYEIVQLLVENGADVNVKDYCGFTAVHTIADNLEDEDGLEMLQYLLDKGACVDGITNFGQDVLFLSFRNTAGTTPFENEGIYKMLEEALQAVEEGEAGFGQSGTSDKLEAEGAGSEQSGTPDKLEAEGAGSEQSGTPDKLEAEEAGSEQSGTSDKLAAEGACSEQPATLNSPIAGNAKEQDKPWTALEFVQNMGCGWNLGNTLDPVDCTWLTNDLDYETAWGNERTTKELIQFIKAEGFDTIRIPVTWTNHVTEAPDYVINEEWLNRVQEIVNWCVEEDMYIILNMHHEAGWLTKASTDYDKTMEKYRSIWTQLANRFGGYSDKLIFESMNEIGFDDLGVEKGCELLNQINAEFVQLIRSTGSNNTERYLLLAGYWTDIDSSCQGIQMPEDERVILSVHYYSPAQFAIAEAGNSWGYESTWGTKEDFAYLEGQMEKLKVSFLDKGIPVIVGEYGCIIKDKEPASRILYLASVANYCKEYGICPILWDNGEELDRANLRWRTEGLAEQILRGTGNGS
ncbi:MAG: cellulase family glycosylhydrolase [Lachnospiraceae bacterium]|nr:cellulase family glycosylhydrolase [Lachnospiraceae bacterium]